MTKTNAKTAAAKKAAAPAPRTSRPAAAPRAGVDPRDASRAQDELEDPDTSGDSGEAVTDEQRRALADDGTLTDAAPATPTTDTVLAALEPGPVGNEGGAPLEEQIVRRRIIGADEPMVKVEVPRAFRLHDNDGSEHAYVAGTASMPRSHAEHWYAKANGVVLKK